TSSVWRLPLTASSTFTGALARPSRAHSLRRTTDALRCQRPPVLGRPVHIAEGRRPLQLRGAGQQEGRAGDTADGDPRLVSEAGGGGERQREVAVPARELGEAPGVGEREVDGDDQLVRPERRLQRPGEELSGRERARAGG